MSQDFSSAVAPAWSDNVPLTTLNDALNSSSTTSPPSTTNSSQRFWSTPARPADSPVKEVMEITLSTDRLINKIVFEAATFPQDIYVEYYDEQLRDWSPFMTADAARSEAVRETILESVPGMIPPANAVTGHLHPQHSFSGHWSQFTARTRPTRAKRLRFVLARSARGHAPRDSFGRAVDYSLGLNNLTVGYEVASAADVPRSRPSAGSLTERETFASTSDVLGSAVNYSVRTNSAKNVLQNGTGASKNTLVWKSEPQPFPWAVVNYYVDGRDSDGNPQTIDRFYLEPLTDGANVNLYYSNDDPTGDFVSGDDPLPPNVGVITGKNGPNVLGSAKNGETNFVDVSNQAIGFNPGNPWWLGMDFSFNFSSLADNANHALLDCGAFWLARTPDGFRVTTAGGDHLTLATRDFDPATPVRVVLAYDGASLALVVWMLGERLDTSARLAVPLSTATVATIRVGGFLGSAPGSGSFELASMVLKVDEVIDEATVEDYLFAPAAYAIKPALALDDDRRTDNAVLRYDPASSTDDFPSGFLGGPPDHYAKMTWSPIARDYVLRKGFLNLPPTKAKYWKLEFCNLVPSPYEVYVPVKRTIKTYTREMWAGRPVVSIGFSANLSVRFPGLDISVGLSSTVRYMDQRVLPMLPRGGDPTRYTATQVRIVNDVKVQATLGAAFWAWNFVSWHAGIWCPRFQTVCTHTYQVMEIEQTSKVAFFVGLQKIEAYRLNYLTTEDTAQYVETFTDLSNIDQDSNWALTGDHQLTSGDSKFAQIDSKPMPANKMIRAVQFAASQSAAKQILPDDDFDDPDHTYWSAVGDGALAPHTQEEVKIGSVLRIDRSPHPLDWGSLQTWPGTWGAFEALTFGQVEQMGNPAGEFGGIASALYDTPPGGRVYAAARVVTPKDLTSPLFVQLVDQSDRVISETGTSVRAGQIAEWYTSYTIGEGGRILAFRWSDFTAPPQNASFVDSFDHVNSSVLALMDSGQAWTPATSGSTVLSHAINTNDAVQNASGTAIDSFSSDTVWGAIDMVVGTMGTGTQVPLIGFDPFALSDQGVLTYLGGTATLPTTSVFGRALVAGDVVHIDVMPSKFVASARKDPSAPLDDTSAPYSLVFYLNGAWTSTVAHRFGARHRKFIQGRANQRFRSFSWTPANYAQPLGKTIWRAPTLALGGSYDSIGSTWTDPTGNTWAKLGDWDNSTSRLVALSDGAEFRIETGAWYGTLHTRVHRTATDATQSPPTTRGYVLVLDATSGVYVDTYGYLIQGGTAWTRLFPSGIPADANISVQFADTKSVAYSIRGTIDAGVTPRMLIARVNGAVVGTWGSAKLGEWVGTTRGLAGSRYYSGVDSDGNPLALPSGQAPGDICTSFDMFNWSPDTSTVALDPNAPTWDDVTKRGTATYAQASQGQLLEPNRFRARVVQKGESNDIWEIDTLSMFVDPIVWYFSNDGGQNFFPAYDIRNNPHGVLTFPPSDPSQPYNPNYGQQLVWRAVSYAPNSSISSLVIRPWYAGLVSGVTHRVGVFSGDPNVMPYDHYGDIEEDARFQVWNLPIPHDWWYQARILERSKDEPVPAPQILLLSESLSTDGGSS